jgi:hypothetical protein
LPGLLKRKLNLSSSLHSHFALATSGCLSLPLGLQPPFDPLVIAAKKPCFGLPNPRKTSTTPKTGRSGLGEVGTTKQGAIQCGLFSTSHAELEKKPQRL